MTATVGLVVAATLVLVSMIVCVTQTSGSAAVSDLCSVCECKRPLLNCSHQRIAELPSSLILPSWLNQWDLSHSQLHNLSGLPLLPTSLKTLWVNNNKLTEWPDEVNSLGLRQLYIGSNSIRRVSVSSLLAIASIQRVDLSDNKLQAWPHVTRLSCPNTSIIAHLNLNKNRLVVLPPNSFACLGTLKQLKLNRNAIRHVTKEVFSALPHLTELDLSRNRVRSVQALSFSQVAALRVLKLQRNQIRYLDDGTFWGAGGLRELLLHHNQLTALTHAWLYGLTNLSMLDVRYNQMQRVSLDAWKSTPNVRWLDLRHNRLTELASSAFSTLDELRELRLDHNALSVIYNDTFKGLHALHTLSLSVNKLRVLEGSLRPWGALPALTSLNLANNSLRYLPAMAFQPAYRLVLLDLSHNPFTGLHPLALDALKHLRTFRVSSTALVCDCRLSWLWPWLMAHPPVPHAQLLVCAQPPSLKGTPLAHVQHDQFVCDEWPQPQIAADHPKDQQSVLNASVSLECVLQTNTGTGHVHVQWTHNGRVLGVQNATSLTIQSVHTTHAGTYQCSATNTHGTVYSRLATLTVHEQPYFVQRPQNMSVRPGMTAQLLCAAEGHPQPHISWNKDGGSSFPAAVQRRLHVQSTDNVFYIVDVRVEDAGLYTCTATNTAGNTTATAILQVQQEPTFRQPLRDKQVQVGQTTVLECMADGAPRPRVSWRRSGRALPKSARYSLTLHNQLLVIVSARPVDSGLYECEISNALGHSTQSATLTVQGSASDSAVYSNSNGNNSEGVQDDDYSYSTLTLDTVHPVLNSTQYNYSNPHDEWHWLGVSVSVPAVWSVLAVLVCLCAAGHVWIAIVCCRMKSAKKKGTMYASAMSGDELGVLYKQPESAGQCHMSISAPTSHAVHDLVQYYTNTNTALLALHGPDTNSMDSGMGGELAQHRQHTACV